MRFGVDECGRQTEPAIGKVAVESVYLVGFSNGGFMAVDLWVHDEARRFQGMVNYAEKLEIDEAKWYFGVEESRWEKLGKELEEEFKFSRR